MPAYLIAEHKITDAAKFEEYRTKVGPMITRHGGRYLTRGGSHMILEWRRSTPGTIRRNPSRSSNSGKAPRSTC